MPNDYSDARLHLRAAIDEIEAARRLAGRVNLPERLGPPQGRAQIEAVEAALADAAEAVAEAKRACVSAGRRGLGVVTD